MTAPSALARKRAHDPPTVTIRCVATFVEVADQRSFRKAAQRLYMDASTASKLVRQLEAELGRQLLNRNTREVSLTAKGQDILPVARRLLHETRKLVRVAHLTS
jgi:DNA-binding transcriptional LysR family regulator